MRRVTLEFGVPPARDTGEGMQLRQGANQRLGVTGKREGAQIARGFVLLPSVTRDEFPYGRMYFMNVGARSASVQALPAVRSGTLPCRHVPLL